MNYVIMCEFQEKDWKKRRKAEEVRLFCPLPVLLSGAVKLLEARAASRRRRAGPTARRGIDNLPEMGYFII